LKCLYLTEIKPSRKNAQQFTDWIEANYPDCTFTEFNVAKKSYPIRNGGRYQGRLDGPENWADPAHAQDCQAVFDAARRLLIVH
jgi:hypothetical protein